MRVFVILLFTVVHLGFGQESTSKSWQELYQEGLKLKDSLPDEACGYFGEAYVKLSLNNENIDVKSSELLSQHVDCLNAGGHMNKAIEILEELTTDFANSNQPSVYLLKHIYSLSRLYESNQQFDFKSQTIRILFDNIDRIHADINDIELLEYLGSDLRNNGDTEIALAVFEFRKKLSEQIKDSASVEYGRALIDIATTYDRKADHNKALKIVENGLIFIENKGKENTIPYAEGLTASSQIFYNLGYYSRAIEAQRKALEILHNESGKDRNYAIGLFSLALSHEAKGRIKISIELQNEALDIVSSLDKVKQEDLAPIFSSLGISYASLGDYKKSLDSHLKSLELTSKNSTNHILYANNIGELYTELGRFDEAFKYFTEALNTLENILGTSHPYYSILLNSIGNMYFKKKDYLNAEIFFNKALVNLNENGDEQNSKYYEFLNDYAVTLIEIGRGEEAVSLMEKNYQQINFNEDTNIEQYYTKVYNLGRLYFRQGNYNKASPLLTKAVNGIRQIFGVSNYRYALMANGLGESYLESNELEEAEEILITANKSLLGQIDKIFRFSNEKDKERYLETLQKNFNDLQRLSHNYNDNIVSLNELNLNNQMALKGLLLNESRNVMDILMNIDDQAIEKDLQQYKSLSQTFEVELLSNLKTKSKVADSLEIELSNFETYLITKYSNYLGEIRSLNKNWSEVREKLNENELAIEFAYFNIQDASGTSENFYKAYVFSRNSEYPGVINLFRESELYDLLNKLSIDKYYSNSKLYELIWKSLEGMIADNSIIYYAPAGLLHQISFNALYNGESHLINDYQLIRLSNTTEILEKRPKPDFTDALFIGGIDYENRDTEGAISKNSNLENQRSTENSQLLTRGETWKYLPGTLTEINNIENIYKQNGVEFKSFQESFATEEKIKNLGDLSPSVLHIATHGFFFESIFTEEVIDDDLSLEDQLRLSDSPFLRSGLLLAGANQRWKHGHWNENTDDGILTSQEISNLNLRNTDLVVLSACETGLGDVKGWEGVYGLQRAFKMAGVERFIMSLWKVPDQATAEFMTEFYKNALNENDINKSFNNTQIKFAEKYKLNPEYWAGFILN